jgi:diguanylate cyclase (GGDEF)-like protein/PAS domain S-box-containing protein
MPDSNSRRFALLKNYCHAAIFITAAASAVVLYGWAFHVEKLKSVVPGLVTMKVNTALGVLLLGISVLLLMRAESGTRTRLLARILAVIVILIAVTSLSEYIFGVNLHIDEALISDPLGSLGTTSPGRMSPATATAFISLGFALIFLDWETKRGRRPAQVLSLWSAVIAIMAICGYIYHASALYKILMYTQVAVLTAICLLLLSVAVFFARPRSGIAGDLTGDGSGSVMARRFLPAVFFIPIFLGWIRLHGQLAGLYGMELGLALYATATTFVFAILVWISARKMNHEFEHRSAAEAGILQLNAELEARVADRTSVLEQQSSELAEQAALLDLAHDGIVVRDMQNRILFWNRGAQKMYGFSAEQAAGKRTYELLKTELSRPIDEIEAQLLACGHWEGEVIHVTRDGVRLNVDARWALQRDVTGTPVRILGINTDITERKQADEALFAEKERAQVTLNSIGDAVICTDTYGNVTFLNRVAEKLSGWSWNDAAGRPMPEILRIVDATTREPVQIPVGSVLSQNRIMNLPPNCILIRRDEFEIPIEDSVSPIHDREGHVAGAVIVFRDVSVARALALQMAHSAQHDFLTGLPNRMLLNDRIAQALVLAARHSKKVAILFLDLDGFKRINDSLGHLIGDRLLQSVAKRLQTCVRASDTVSRQGGDEFVVLLSEVEQTSDAAISAKRMLRSVSETHFIDLHELQVSTSIGISVFPDDGPDTETLIKHADAAMYLAKEGGRKEFRFFSAERIHDGVLD